MAHTQRALLAALLLLAGGCGRHAEPARDPMRTAAGAYERAWPVMGTMLHVTVWDEEESEAAVIAQAVRAEVALLDSLLSNYRDDSDVSRVNAAAGSGAWVAVSPMTVEALGAALAFAEATGGAFDPTVGPVVDVWGFYREEGAMPSASAIDSARALTGWQLVEMDRSPPRVRLPRAGMRLDFGAIGKGFAVSRTLEVARDRGAERIMVDVGGNIGVSGSAPGGGDWRLGLRHPRLPELPFAIIDVARGALATSGDYERYFEHGGVRYAHIIDPRTGWPVQGVASVSVLAPDGTASDGLSTSLFVLGVERGCAFIEALPGVAAVWVRAPEQPNDPVRVVVGGPEAGRVELLAEADVRRCGDAAR